MTRLLLPRSGHWIAVATLCLSLSMLAATGAWGDEERKIALDFYRELAEGGSADAQLTLGDIYRKGEGVAVDLVEAYAWYYLAAQQGVEEAIGPMNDTLKALPKDRWAEARHRAETYERRYAPQHK